MLTYFLIICCSVAFTVDGVEPQFNVVAKNVTVVTGQTAVLPCSVDYLGEFKKVSVKWVVWLDHREKLLTFEDRRIIADERISLERPYVKEWNLHIRNVKPTDQGKYSCQINTDPVQVRPIRLHVYVPARINRQLSTSDLTAKEGETVTLVCNATGVPAPTVTWFRILSGARENTDTGKERIGVEGEVLLIHNVTRYCDDVYECVAFNNVPPADTKRMRVNVEFPPEIRLQNKRIGQSRGKETILECIVQAFPIGVTEWRRDGEKIIQSWKYRSEVYTDDRITITLSLRIMDINEDDYGTYTCEAENLLGKDFEEMTLYEYPVYKPPTTTTPPPPPTPKIIDYEYEKPKYINGGERPWNSDRHSNSATPTYRTAPPRGDTAYETGGDRKVVEGEPVYNLAGSKGHVYDKNSAQAPKQCAGVLLWVLTVCVTLASR